MFKAYLEKGMRIKLEVDVIPPYLSFWGIIKSYDENYLIIEIEGKYAQKEERKAKCTIPKDTKACVFETVILTGENNVLVLKPPNPKGIELIQRRKFIRVVTEIPVDCYLIGYKDTKIESPKFFPAVIKDISGGGVLLNTTLNLPIGTVVVFELDLGRSKLVLTAKVLRNIENTTDGSRDLGCEFIGIDESDLQKISSYCSKLQLHAKRAK